MRAICSSWGVSSSRVSSRRMLTFSPVARSSVRHPVARTTVRSHEWKPQPRASQPPQRTSARSRSTSPRSSSTTCAAAIKATKWPDREVGSRPRACSSRRSRRWPTTGRRDYDWRTLRGALRGPAALRHRDRRGRHPLHPRALRARGRAAADRHPRVAGLDGRAAQDHRSADQADGARRERGGRLPSRDPVAAGPRVLRQADRDRLGPHPHRQGLGRADGAPRVRPLRRAGR